VTRAGAPTVINKIKTHLVPSATASSTLGDRRVRDRLVGCRLLLLLLFLPPRWLLRKNGCAKSHNVDEN
jgi:hypothetical protein